MAAHGLTGPLCREPNDLGAIDGRLDALERVGDDRISRGRSIRAATSAPLLPKTVYTVFAATSAASATRAMVIRA